MVGKSTGPVRLVSAAIDETPRGEIVLRGVIEAGTLDRLHVDDYQREALPLTSLSSIIDALKSGEVLPDIELGMRGESYSVKEDGVHVLRDPTFIIDGLQRVNGALHLRNTNPDVPVRLGATVHFSTTKEWERDRFRILNMMRSKVSPNVLLRNRRETNPAMDLLHTLSTTDKSFVLHGRVSWGQRMTRQELITALTFAKVVGVLHTHKAPAKRSNIDDLVPALDKSVEVFGVTAMRENTRTFFNLIDECWNIRRIQYKEGATYIKGSFLYILALYLSDHHDFWVQPDEKKLFVAADLRRKIGQFPIHDPSIANLASSGGKARDMLYMMFRDHVNSGRRTKRPRSRHGGMVMLEDTGSEE